MPRRPTNITQSQATSIFKALKKAGVIVRVKLPDGTIIEITDKLMTPNMNEDTPPDASDDLKALI
jgi:CTP-dependent riboflavin kinase